VPLHLWRQLLRLELHYEKAHEEVAAQYGSYYYLSFIGTHPEARGKGYGSLLLSHITQRADREGRWCLLEATSDRSQVRPAEPSRALLEQHSLGTTKASGRLLKHLWRTLWDICRCRDV
jgi:GNAT superfamily N-acetyltransferase